MLAILSNTLQRRRTLYNTSYKKNPSNTKHNM